MCGAIATALSAFKPSSDQSRAILSSLSLFTRTAPINHLAPLLLDSGIFAHILVALEDDKASGTILAAYLDILMRIALVDPNALLQMIAETARRQGKDGEKVLEETLDAIWRNFDYVTGARSRKAVATGAGALLTTVSQTGSFFEVDANASQGNPHCLDRLNGEFRECLKAGGHRSDLG